MLNRQHALGCGSHLLEHLYKLTNLLPGYLMTGENERKTLLLLVSELCHCPVWLTHTLYLIVLEDISSREFSLD
jgi:hypothetical protein